MMVFFLFPGVWPEASPSVRVHRHLLRPWQRRRGHEVQGEHKRPIRVSEKFNDTTNFPVFLKETVFSFMTLGSAAAVPFKKAESDSQELWQVKI